MRLNYKIVNMVTMPLQQHRLGTLILAALLIVMSTSTVLTFKTSSAQQDDTWYLGKSAKANTYYIYNIQDIDVNEGAPYTMALYFKEQDSTGNWVVPVYIIENNGNVIQGTLSLGDNLAIRTSGSTIPKEMNPYIDGYKDSLTWLEAFTSKGKPQSLKAISWGKIACIGCGTLDPAGSEKVTAAGTTYDATVLVNHRGQKDSKIWVAKELPYPVKALTYADVTTGQPPIQYAFDLKETGSGQPPVVQSQVKIPTPPLTLNTGRGTYVITLNWSPEQIQPGQETTFTTSFTDSKGAALKRVNYDLTIRSASNNTVIQQFKNEFTGDDNTGEVKAKFAAGGPVIINVKVNSISGIDTGNFVEDANFALAVVPEFPVGIASVVSIAAIAVAVILARMRGKIPGNNAS